jgi:hypothetical protein
MLPFTKRPLRNPDGEPASREDLPPVSKLVARDSVSDAEMTSVVPSMSPRSLAEGSSRRAVSSVRRPSVRNLRTNDAHDEEGSTIVRDAPQVARRAPAPVSSFSPAAVIRATLDAPRSRREGALLPGPPSELLEDRNDLPPRSDVRAPFARTAMFEGPPSQPPPGWGYDATQRSNSNAPVSFVPRSQPTPRSQPVPRSHPGAYRAAPTSQVPAHFATPRVPYNGDPPGTAITAAHPVGRTTSSWAIALLAFGLFVGVLAIAALQGSDSVADTTASFVDPSRAPSKSAGAVPAVPAAATAVRPPFGAETLPPPAPPVRAGGVVGSFTAAPPPAAPAVAPPPAVVVKATTRRAAYVVSRAAAAKSASLSASEDDSSKKEAEKPRRRAAPDDETKKALEALQKAQLESAASF